MYINYTFDLCYWIIQKEKHSLHSAFIFYSAPSFYSSILPLDLVACTMARWEIRCLRAQHTITTETWSSKWKKWLSLITIASALPLWPCFDATWQRMCPKKSQYLASCLLRRSGSNFEKPQTNCSGTKRVFVTLMFGVKIVIRDFSTVQVFQLGSFVVLDEGF